MKSCKNVSGIKPPPKEQGSEKPCMSEVPSQGKHTPSHPFNSKRGPRHLPQTLLVLLWCFSGCWDAVPIATDCTVATCVWIPFLLAREHHFGAKAKPLLLPHGRSNNHHIIFAGSHCPCGT